MEKIRECEHYRITEIGGQGKTKNFFIVIMLIPFLAGFTFIVISD